MIEQQEDDAVELFRRRCQEDTGFVCRQLIGWNYDEGAGGKKLNVGTGGVRSTGAHQKIVAMLDAPNPDPELARYVLISGSRGCYKSAIGMGFCDKHIIRDPNVRIWWIAATDGAAEEKSLAVRATLESPKVVRYFGVQKPDPGSGKPWEATRFTVAGRTDSNLQNTTFSAYSLKHMPTGGRANIILCDDIVDEKSHTNQEMIQKAKDAFAYLQPFLAVGGLLVVIINRWDDDDLLHDLENSPLFAAPHGDKLILGAGVRVVTNELGHKDLVEDEGGVTFPHLSVPVLRQKLLGMIQKGDYRKFVLQYLNEVPPMGGGEFQRHFFQPLRWGADMRTLSGYLMTDTATSQRSQGSYSALAYVGLDADDSIYLLDGALGHWPQSEFVTRFFDLLERWRKRVNHCGEVWEKVSIASAFEFSIQQEARRRQQRLNTIEVNRTSEDSKNMRIKQMHTPMYRKQFWVVDTFPRTFEDLGGTRILYDPEGYVDPRTKIPQPAGELVDQFMRLGNPTQKKDLADAIALIVECEKTRNNGHLRRYCQYRKPRDPESAPAALTEQRIRDYRAAHIQTLGGSDDWLTRTFNDIGL